MRPASAPRRAGLTPFTGQVRSRVRRHRRLLAGALLALAAAIAVDTLAPAEPAGVPVVTAAADLAAGTVLAAGDLAITETSPNLVPDGALGLGDAAGRALAAPLRRGEVLTDVRLVGPGLLAGQPEGTVAVPVRPSDPAVTALVRVGDRVRVLAGPDLAGFGPAGPDLADTDHADLQSHAGGTGGGAAVLIPTATVLAVPTDSAGGGLLGDGGGSAVLVLAVRGQDAPGLAAAGDGRWLAVALLPP